MSFIKIADETTDPNGYSLRTIVFEGFEIQLVRSPRAQTGEFFPSRVKHGERELWNFGRDFKKLGFTGHAILRDDGEELIISLVTGRQLIEVIPVRDLLHRQRIGTEVIGGRKLPEIIAMKEIIASEEGLEPVWTKREAVMRSALVKTSAQERRRTEKQVDQAQLERDARRAARDAKRNQIKGRQRIFAFTEAGDRRHGHPVVGDEWLVLKDGAFCIAVTSLDEETGAIGDVIESFVVKQSGSKKTRHNVVPVSLELPKTVTKSLQPEDLKFVLLHINSSVEEAILVSDMTTVRALRDHGVNSGTLVAHPKPSDPTKFVVDRLIGGTIERVTEVRRAD